jgi:small-conductance mechanosensitive channel
MRTDVVIAILVIVAIYIFARLFEIPAQSAQEERIRRGITVASVAALAILLVWFFWGLSLWLILLCAAFTVAFAARVMVGTRR